MSAQRSYCLDANVLIQAWQKYYSPRLCPSYWERLATLGQQGRLFVPRKVVEEIEVTDDDLKVWVQAGNLPVREETGAVAVRLREIYDANPIHQHLVDNIRNRSKADPWVIAHAMDAGASVVTKEEFVTLPPQSTKIRIPHVCSNMGVPWMNDFDFLVQIGMQFRCDLPVATPVSGDGAQAGLFQSPS